MSFFLLAFFLSLGACASASACVSVCVCVCGGGVFVAIVVVIVHLTMIFHVIIWNQKRHRAMGIGVHPCLECLWYIESTCMSGESCRRWFMQRLCSYTASYYYDLWFRSLLLCSCDASLNSQIPSSVCFPLLHLHYHSSWVSEWHSMYTFSCM